MAAKSWRLVVTEIGGTASLSEASVEANNWMTALTLARDAIGESGSVPPGASCQVAPDGKVTIHDPVARRTYRLAPGGEKSLSRPPPAGPRVPPDEVPRRSSAPPPPRSSENPPLAAPTVPRRSSVPPPSEVMRDLAMPKTAKVPQQTIAYHAKELGIAPPAQEAKAPGPSERPASLPKTTIAYDAKELGIAAATPVGASELKPAQEPGEPAASPKKKKKKGRQKTIAYDARELGLAAQEARAPEPRKQKAPQKTIAYDANELGITAPAAEADAPEPAKEKSPQKTIAYNAADLGITAPAEQHQAPEPAEQKAAHKTIAYNAADLGIAAPAGTKAPEPADALAYKTLEVPAVDLGVPPPAEEIATPAEEAGAPEPVHDALADKTIEFTAVELGIAPPVTEAATAEQVLLAPGEPERPTLPDAPICTLLHSRDEEPTERSPLSYRERVFFIEAEASPAVAEAVLMARFEEMREELGDVRKGKLVNMALFDHRWEGRPLRPPLLSLQWKDWRGEPVLSRPPPPPEEAPAPAPAPAPKPPSATERWTPASAPIAPTAGAHNDEPHDDRLALAFEALQDLFFLTTPVEGLNFVMKLIDDFVPSEAKSACLYDINSDEFRFVALTGPGAEERKGEGVPRLSGLLGAAALKPDRALLVEDVADDERYDPGVDGRIGIDPLTMAVIALTYQGRLLGMLQLINRQRQAQYSRADANVLQYMAEKLGEFLYSARMRSDRSN